MNFDILVCLASCLNFNVSGAVTSAGSEALSKLLLLKIQS